MIERLVETGFAITLVLLLVLAVRRPVARCFGAGWAYALWLLPALRLVLPPLPQLSPEISLPPIVVFIPPMDGVTAPLPAYAGPGQWVPFMLALWAGGAVTFIIWHWLTYRAFLAMLRAGAHPADPPSHGGIATIASDAVDGPLAVGFLHRRIVVPTHFSRRYSPAERRLALEHELVHHRRGDIWWNLAGLFILALNWFNPVAWFAFHAFRTDQELACDAAVAKRASADERHDYARALVKSASRPGLIAACPLNRADQLKRRLKMLRDHRVSGARTAGGLAAFAALLAAGLTFSTIGRPGGSEQPIVYAATAPARMVSGSHALPSSAATAAAAARPAGHAHVIVHHQSASAAARAATAAAGDRLAGLGRGAELIPLSGASDMLSAIRMAPVQAAVAPPEGRAVFRHARLERIVTFHVEGSGARAMFAVAPEPARLTAVHAAVERAMAEAKDEELRERLGQVKDALERQLDRFGMESNIN